MPRKPEEESISLVDLLQMASSDLSQKSVRPNMHMYKPHDKQKFLHCSYAKEKLFIGGNRSGKTVWNVMECIWWLTKKHPFRPDVNAIVEPIRGRLVCVSFIDGLDKIILPYFKQFLPSSELINGNWEDSYSRQSRTLTLANGSFIEFMSYDQELEKFAGTSRHFCSFDEEPPQAVYIECKMRLMDTGGSYWISMTPVEGMTWIYFDLYEPHRRGENTDLQILEINTEENPAIDRAELDRALRGLSDDEKKARREGTFVQLGGKVYPEYDNRIHVVNNFKLERYMTIYTSYDHGWRHPAAWLWHAVLPNQHIITFHEIIEPNLTIAQMSQMVHEYEAETLKPLGMEVFCRAADPATAQTSGITGMSVLQHYAENGLYFATEGIPKGPGSVDIGLNMQHEYLEIDPDTNTPFWQIYYKKGATKEEFWGCKTLNEQMRNMHFEKYASKKMEYEHAPKLTISKKDDDGPD